MPTGIGSRKVLTPRSSKVPRRSLPAQAKLIEAASFDSFDSQPSSPDIMTTKLQEKVNKNNINNNNNRNNNKDKSKSNGNTSFIIIHINHTNHIILIHIIHIHIIHIHIIQVLNHQQVQILSMTD